MVELSQVLNDGKSESGAAKLAGTPLIHPIKALKNAFLIFIRDAGAVICHFDDHLIFLIAMGGNHDPTPLAAIFDGIVDEID